jgi:hypothetical protein
LLHLISVLSWCLFTCNYLLHGFHKSVQDIYIYIIHTHTIYIYIYIDIHIHTYIHTYIHIKARIIAAVKNIDASMLTRVWQQLEYCIDVCRVTSGAHIEDL